MTWARNFVYKKSDHCTQRSKQTHHMKSTSALIIQKVTTCIDNINLLNSKTPLISDSNSCPNLIWSYKYLK